MVFIPVVDSVGEEFLDFRVFKWLREPRFRPLYVC